MAVFFLRDQCFNSCLIVYYVFEMLYFIMLWGQYGCCPDQVALVKGNFFSPW